MPAVMQGGPRGGTAGGGRGWHPGPHPTRCHGGRGAAGRGRGWHGELVARGRRCCGRPRAGSPRQEHADLPRVSSQQAPACRAQHRRGARDRCWEQDQSLEEQWGQAEGWGARPRGGGVMGSGRVPSPLGHPAVSPCPVAAVHPVFGAGGLWRYVEGPQGWQHLGGAGSSGGCTWQGWVPTAPLGGQPHSTPSTPPVSPARCPFVRPAAALVSPRGWGIIDNKAPLNALGLPAVIYRRW